MVNSIVYQITGICGWHDGNTSIRFACNAGMNPAHTKYDERMSQYKKNSAYGTKIAVTWLETPHK
jgi:hypothetical protein